MEYQTPRCARFEDSNHVGYNTVLDERIPTYLKNTVSSSPNIKRTSGTTCPATWCHIPEDLNSQTWYSSSLTNTTVQVVRCVFEKMVFRKCYGKENERYGPEYRGDGTHTLNMYRSASTSVCNYYRCPTPSSRGTAEAGLHSWGAVPHQAS